MSMPPLLTLSDVYVTPFGLLLFTMKGVAPPSITMGQVYAASVPYILFGLIVLVAIFFFPPIATWLPGLLGN